MSVFGRDNYELPENTVNNQVAAHESRVVAHSARPVAACTRRLWIQSESDNKSFRENEVVMKCQHTGTREYK
ncbi:hypothetical protein L484_004924 [Morus notabilis]|uniref:Uncharacterized protein n=1 Tax=Morus notabilis TaxID=981085 RepID=W9REA1_9ROSA|nr:hypothetical protein L484_004924 [Morus notabilis]